MKKTVRIIAMLAVLIFALTACGTQSDASIKINNEYASAELSEENKLEPTAEMQKAAEKGRFQLLFGGENLNIGIYDSATGKTWYTNRADADSDAIALAESVDLLKAQLSVDYYDKNGNFATMNSYTDCVATDQYEIYAVKDGIAVIYTLGALERTVDDIPQKISDARFKSKILDKLSEEDRTAITENYYNYYESEKMWAIKTTGRVYYKEVLKLLDKAGYGEKELAEDNRQYGLSVNSASKIGFKITVFYTLTENGLSVSVPCEKIEYNEEYPIYNLSVLPNFGAQKLNGQTADGFLLIPDGSGALMRFNSEISSEYYYEAPVYGYDEAVTLRNNTNNIRSEQVTLPVFGISDGASSVIAVITDGAANATVNAARAGRNSEQFTVNASFSVINMDYVTLNGTSKATTTTVFQNKPYSGSYSIEYILADKASYSDMAHTLREYLEKNKYISAIEENESALSFYLETIGGAVGGKSFMGLSYTGVVSTTSYEENIAITKALSELGVENIKLKLMGWANNGVFGKCNTNINLISSLGGKKGFNKLIDYCAEQNIAIYPDVDLISGSTGGGETKSTVSRMLDSRPVEAAEHISSALDTADDVFSYAYSPSRLLGIAERFLKSYGKLNLKTVSLNDNGSVIYADYNNTLDKQYDRAEAMHYVVRQTAAVADKMDGIMVNKGNLYSLAYARHAVNVAMDDSWMLCEDESVPFLQLVLHGRVDLGSKPINLQSDVDKNVLRCAEYGVAPLFQFTYEKTEVLSNAGYTYNYSACYEDWLDEAAEIWKSLNDVLSSVQGKTMTGHEKIADNVYRTDYENGVSVYVNYSEKDYNLHGTVIPAGKFIKEGGN